MLGLGYISLMISWLISYILGGITFVFILGFTLWSIVWFYGSSPIGDPDPSKRIQTKLEAEEVLKANQTAGLGQEPQAELEGFFIIRRSFKADPNSQPQSREFLSGKEDGEGDAKDVANKPLQTKDAGTGGVAPKPTYAGRLLQTYRTVSKSAGSSKPPDVYVCKLKGSVLFIYKQEKDKDGERDCVAALTIDQFNVAMEDHDGPWRGKDGRMFAKRHAIVLRKLASNSNEKQGLGVLAKGMSGTNTDTAAQEEAPWFLFSKRNSRTEDFYLALLKVSANPPSYSRCFSHAHMQWFIDQVENRPDRSTMDWFNLFVGRIFLGINQTALVEQFVIDKINKKLALVQHPLIGPLVATEVNVGHIPPIFSDAMLKDTKASGEIAFEMHMDYRQPEELPGSGIRITIEATKIGFKAVLAVLVKSISGNMRVVIKAPPSNRFWWGFTEEPQMELAIEPIVGSRTINLSMVLSFIERKLREGLSDSVVLPNMDDTPFFNTSKLDIRGGIFDEASKHIQSEKHKDDPSNSDDSASFRDDVLAEKSSASQKASSQKSAKSSKSSKSVTKSTTKPVPPSKQTTVDDLDVRDRHQVVRSETTPMLGDRRATSTTVRGFSSRSRNGTSDGSQLSKSSLADEPSETKRFSSAVTGSDVPRSSSPSSQTSRETPKDSSASLISTEVSETSSPSKPMTTSAILHAVRARDKEVIQNQVSTAKDSVKKWGTNFMNKRRGVKQADDDEHAGMPSSYYVPSEDARPVPALNHRHADGRTLQERLAAAAAAAGQATSPRDSSFPQRRPISSISADTDSTTASAPSVPVRQNHPHVESSGSELGTSPPTVTQPTLGRTMMVPSVPKRPGVVTSIANDPMSTTTTSALSTSAPGAPPSLPARSAPAPPKVSRGDSHADSVTSEPLISLSSEHSSEEGELIDLSESMTKSASAGGSASV